MTEKLNGVWMVVETTLRNSGILAGFYDFNGSKLRIVQTGGQSRVMPYRLEDDCLILQGADGVVIRHRIDLISDDEFITTNWRGDKTLFSRVDPCDAVNI